jgi:FkbM family methyltransferase
MRGWTAVRRSPCGGPTKSTRDARVPWSAPNPYLRRPARSLLAALLSHFRRLARDVQHDIWPTPELGVLQQLESRARREPRRTRGQIAVPPYRFEYVDAMSTWPQWDDIFIHHSLAFATDVRTPRIIDCGANIGLASLYFKLRFPYARLTAFEPDPGLAAVCRSNLALNDAAENAEVRQAAVWTFDGTLDFVCEGTDSGTIASLNQPVEGPVAHVPSVQLRDWLQEPVDLLKLDIEGAELAVLDDCRDRLQHVRALIVELHEFDPAKRVTGRVLDLLSAAGFVFEMRAVTPLPWRSQGQSPFADASLVWVATVRAWHP